MCLALAAGEPARLPADGERDHHAAGRRRACRTTRINRTVWTSRSKPVPMPMTTPIPTRDRQRGQERARQLRWCPSAMTRRSPAASTPRAVVSVLGSSTSAGEVDERRGVGAGQYATSPDRWATRPWPCSATPMSTAASGDSVVAVLGNVELGPHADVQGDVVAVGGDLIRDPAAIVHGNIQNVMLFGHMGNYEWLRTWVHNCLMYGRPLAFAPGLGWAWTHRGQFPGAVPADRAAVPERRSTSACARWRRILVAPRSPRCSRSSASRSCSCCCWSR